MDQDPLPRQAWHALPWEEAARALETDPEAGLSPEEASVR